MFPGRFLFTIRPLSPSLLCCCFCLPSQSLSELLPPDNRNYDLLPRYSVVHRRFSIFSFPLPKKGSRRSSLRWTGYGTKTRSLRVMSETGDLDILSFRYKNFRWFKYQYTMSSLSVDYVSFSLILCMSLTDWDFVLDLDPGVLGICWRWGGCRLVGEECVVLVFKRLSRCPGNRCCPS